MDPCCESPLPPGPHQTGGMGGPGGGLGFGRGFTKFRRSWKTWGSRMGHVAVGPSFRPRGGMNGEHGVLVVQGPY